MASSATAVPMGRSTSRRALIIALVFGAIAALLVFYFLSRAGSAAAVTSPVVIAAQDIALGAQLAPTDLKLVNFPKAGVHPLALQDKNAMQAAIGQIALIPFTAGEQVLTTQITKDRSQISLAADIPAGKRAMSITVSQVTANAGFVKPGDVVDVVGIFPTNAPLPANAITVGSGHLVAVTVVQSLKVLAIGAAVQAPQQSGQANGLTPSNAGSVTFLLTPEQASKLFLAEDTGTLRLVQRPLGETTPVTVQPVDNTLQGIISLPTGQ